MHRVFGTVSGLLAVLTSFVYILSKTAEIYGEVINAAGTGAFLFFVASIGLFVGIAKY